MAALNAETCHPVMSGNPKNAKNICTSAGVPRKSSMYAVLSARTGGGP